jgi:hypothetical protein
MKYKSGLVTLLLMLAVAGIGYAQEQPPTAAESLDNLRAQLFDVKAKEEDLQARAQQLEESLKPENIERSLAGVGSTRPEELRESRRRQLTIERNGVLAQLKLLETTRQRLETAIANAEARAYQESAQSPASNHMVLTGLSAYRWLMWGGGGFAALALAGGVLLYRRKLRVR